MQAGWRKGVEKPRRRKQRAREAPNVEAAGKARAERTRNMDSMVVTLEVSRLSGWLNANAPCRVKREASEEGRHAAGWRKGVEKPRRRKQRAREAPNVEAAGRGSAERTSNIRPMVETLEVSRLSGWLNADAPCRVKREVSEEGRHAGRVAEGHAEAAAAQAACREAPIVEVAGRARAERT
jgi:hypothetical protein